jgi:hypothetical protein
MVNLLGLAADRVVAAALDRGVFLGECFKE